MLRTGQSLRPRFAPGLSTTHGGLATGDLGVSPDRTRTGWLPSACRWVTSQQPPCRHGAQAAGRTPRTPGSGEPACTRPCNFGRSRSVTNWPFTRDRLWPSAQGRRVYANSPVPPANLIAADGRLASRIRTLPDSLQIPPGGSVRSRGTPYRYRTPRFRPAQVLIQETNSAD
jgi:hypothetical protein